MMTSGILDSMKLSAFAKKFFSEDFTMADIPEEYYSKKDGVKLMSSGKIHKANEGCACTMNSILEQFVAHLTSGRMKLHCWIWKPVWSILAGVRITLWTAS